MIEIIAIKYNNNPLEFPIVGKFSYQGGCIGNDADNVLVLPDPQGLLCKRHLLIEPDFHGNYRLINISTVNSVLLNSILVTQGEQRHLNQGDLISIGSYLLEVRMAAKNRCSPDVDAILDQGRTPALMSDNAPLGIATIEPVVGLEDFAENPGHLLKDLDQENKQELPLNSLVMNPSAIDDNPLLAESVLDPLAIFSSKEKSLENWLADSKHVRATSGGTLSNRPVNELHIPFFPDLTNSDVSSVQSGVLLGMEKNAKKIMPQVSKEFTPDSSGHSLHMLHAALLEGLKLDDLPAYRNLDVNFMRTLGVLMRTVIDVTARLMAVQETVKH